MASYQSEQSSKNNMSALSHEDLCTEKNKIYESLTGFFAIFQSFSDKKLTLEVDCHEHFQSIRRTIDTHRVELDDKIQDIYLRMIAKTTEMEHSYWKSVSGKLEYQAESIEEKSIRIEEMFCDPHLTIADIRDIQLKQQRSIDSIQIKLDEMNLIKDDVAVSNMFTPYSIFNFNSESFGKLALTDYVRFDPFKSQILTGSQPTELIKLCDFDSSYKYTLLFRASVQGFGSKNFHDKCDNHANTLTIFKVKGSSFIFGGCSKATWDDDGLYGLDSTAFIFSLTNKDNKPCKIKIKPNSYDQAIRCDPGLGPSFGVSDIYIDSDSNINSNSFTQLGWSYNYSKAFGSKESHSFLTGASGGFSLSEIEVYQRNYK